MKNRCLRTVDLWVIGITALVLCEACVGGMAVCSAADSTRQQDALPAADALFREGRDHHQKREFAIAAEKYSQAITKGKKTADVYSYLGEALFVLDRYEEALTTLSEAIRLDPKDVRAFAVRGFTLDHQGKHEEAIQNYSAGLAITPNKLTATLLEARGETHWILGQIEKAMEDFEAIIARNPTQARGYVLRGKLLGAKGKYREAINDLSSALERDATRKLPLFYRGYDYGCLKDYDNALRDYTALIQAVPEAAIVYAYRGSIHNDLENYRLAETDLRYALDHGYRELFVYLTLADSLAGQGQIDQALAMNNEVFSLGSGDARYFMEAYFQRGDFFMTKKQYDNSRSFYEKGIAVAAQLGMRSVLSRRLAALKTAVESDDELRLGGQEILKVLEDAVTHVQSNPQYEEGYSCELESPAPLLDEKGISNNY